MMERDVPLPAQETQPSANHAVALGRQGENLWRYRINVILPFVVAGLIIAPLAWFRKSIEVELDLRITRIAFDIAPGTNEGIFGSLPLRSLRIVNFDRVALGPGATEAGKTPADGSDRPNQWQSISLSGKPVVQSTSEFAAATLYDVALDSLSIKDGSRITIEWSDENPSIVKVRVGGRPLSGRATGGRELMLTCQYCALGAGDEHAEPFWVRSTSASPHVIGFGGRGTTSTLGLELAPGAKLSEQGIGIRGSLDFTTLDGRQRRVSTLTGDGGTVSLPELKKDNIRLAATDLLLVDRIERFSLKSIEIDKGLHVRLYGVAGRLEMGPAGFTKEFQPSILEWLFASKGWLVYPNALILAATTAMAILRKLRFIPEK